MVKFCGQNQAIWTGIHAIRNFIWKFVELLTSRPTFTNIKLFGLELTPEGTFIQRWIFDAINTLIWMIGYYFILFRLTFSFFTETCSDLFPMLRATVITANYNLQTEHFFMQQWTAEEKSLYLQLSDKHYSEYKYLNSCLKTCS